MSDTPWERAALEYGEWFETLSPETLPRVHRLCDPRCRFRDPFNDVVGPDAIQRVFEHMFATCDAPRFSIRERVTDGAVAYYRWDFRFRLKGRTIAVEGVSRVSFDEAGRVTEHIDYWDAASQLYARMPWVGGLFRWLARKLSAG